MEMGIGIGIGKGMGMGMGMWMWTEMSSDAVRCMKSVVAGGW